MTVVLAVSPHLDDAVLSYGGSLANFAERGAAVIVYTVFAGIATQPYSAIADEFHTQWRLASDPVLSRRLEDSAAVKRLGATERHGEFLDCIYRREGGRWLITPETHPYTVPVASEQELQSDIETTIEQLIEDIEPGLVVTCAAIGHHIDHVRTRNAASTAALRQRVPIRLWQDQPYAALYPAFPPMSAGSRINEATVEPVPPAAWRTKLDAVSRYRSQLTALNHEGIGILDQLDRQGKSVAEGRQGDDARAELTWLVISEDGDADF